MCLDYLPRGQKFNKLYFKDVILHQIDRGLNREGSKAEATQ
jgi:hypothetical protein